MSSSLFFKKHQPWITIDAIDVPFYQLSFLQPYLWDQQMRTHNHRLSRYNHQQQVLPNNKPWVGTFLIKGDQTLLSKKNEFALFDRIGFQDPYLVSIQTST